MQQGRPLIQRATTAESTACSAFALGWIVRSNPPWLLK